MLFALRQFHPVTWYDCIIVATLGFFIAKGFRIEPIIPRNCVGRAARLPSGQLHGLNIKHVWQFAIDITSAAQFTFFAGYRLMQKEKTHTLCIQICGPPDDPHYDMIISVQASFTLCSRKELGS